MASYQELRQRHVAELARVFPEWVQRLRWPAERLRQERQDRLRELLRVALASSPWHRERLGGIDPETFTEDDLPQLPAMTKDDLMANWDEVVADRRLTLELVERHLSGLTSDAYLFDEVHAIASGGSTGRRGVYVHGWRAWAEEYAGFMRPVLWDRAASPELAGPPSTVAMVAAQHATHMTSSMGQTFANPNIHIERFPVTWPVQRIVAGLNAYRPVAILGYPSALALLAAEARAGRLRIAPRRLISTSEPLLPEVRRTVEEAFAAPIANVYGTSEAGPVGVGCWRGPGIHLSDDLVIVEPVNQAGRPAGAVRDPLRQALRDRDHQPAAAADPLRADRPGDGPGGSLRVRVGAPADRRRGGAAGRRLPLPGWRGRPPARVPVGAVQGGLDRRVPGAADRDRRGGAGGRGARRPGRGRARAGEGAGAGRVADPSVDVRVVDRLERQAAGKVRRFQPIPG